MTVARYSRQCGKFEIRAGVDARSDTSPHARRPGREIGSHARCNGHRAKDAYATCISFVQLGVRMRGLSDDLSEEGTGKALQHSFGGEESGHGAEERITLYDPASEERTTRISGKIPAFTCWDAGGCGPHATASSGRNSRRSGAFMQIASQTKEIHADIANTGTYLGTRSMRRRQYGSTSLLSASRSSAMTVPRSKEKAGHKVHGTDVAGNSAEGLGA
ncbi:hypothetical protein B0H17DRAFT_1152031 [Mycena rosella]|uniref:Uncharacterized protein n=1 Tax=Mycena rosella TaxID=1033263 RepID=A0AAD7BH02_MYCRO|nr:hypothetical protein B0H17DRAFT_1152031 [Mycena rosella]